VTCGFPVTLDEAEYLRKKLDEVRNVSVAPIEDLSIAQGKAFGMTDLPKTLTAIYSDTSTGEYTITGQASVKNYGFPLVSNSTGAIRGISLDMTYLEDNGNHYYVWAGRYTNNYSGAGDNENQAEWRIAEAKLCNSFGVGLVHYYEVIQSMSEMYIPMQSQILAN